MIYLKSGCAEEYKRYHAAVWPEVLNTMTDCNIHNYSVFFKDDVLLGYFEYHGMDIKKTGPRWLQTQKPKSGGRL